MYGGEKKSEITRNNDYGSSMLSGGKVKIPVQK
jgi:hypothetical protein